MRGIVISTPGGPESLVVADVPMPTVGEHDVLIKVAAAGLNRADLLQRRGSYPPPPGASPLPGLEASGIVEQVGAAVREFKPGDAVCALLQGGGYAEYCSVHEGQVLPVPTGVGVVEAASLPEAYFTVWSNVFERAALEAGERFLVHGGSSGIGAAAIQLAAARGATVFATAGSDDKCRFCESLGAAHVFNYKTQDFVAGVQEATQGEGVNVILDMIAGDYLNRNIDALAIEGRLVMIATMGGVHAKMNALKVMTKRLSITGSTLRGRSVEYKQALKLQLLRHVWPLFAAGKLRLTVDRMFDFDQAAAAHAYMESSAHKGKILLKVNG
jgi:NADPH2:quinone reductase